MQQEVDRGVPSATQDPLAADPRDGRVLIIDCDTERAESHASILQFIDYVSQRVASPAELDITRRRPRDWLAVLVGKVSDTDALLRFVDWLRRDRLHPPILILQPYFETLRKQLMLDVSACMPVQTPIKFAQMSDLLRRASELQGERSLVEAPAVAPPGPTGNSAAMPTNSTGTGRTSRSCR